MLRKFGQWQKLGQIGLCGCRGRFWEESIENLTLLKQSWLEHIPSRKMYTSLQLLSNKFYLNSRDILNEQQKVVEKGDIWRKKIMRKAQHRCNKDMKVDFVKLKIRRWRTEAYAWRKVFWKQNLAAVALRSKSVITTQIMSRCFVFVSADWRNVSRTFSCVADGISKKSLWISSFLRGLYQIVWNCLTRLMKDVILR